MKCIKFFHATAFQSRSNFNDSIFTIHGLDEQTVDDVLDYLASRATQHEIFYLWRPFLKDPKDDHVLELAVKSNSQFIISYNKKDFTGIQQFGINVLSPSQRGSREKFLDALDKVPDIEPEEWDKLP